MKHCSHFFWSHYVYRNFNMHAEYIFIHSHIMQWLQYTTTQLCNNVLLCTKRHCASLSQLDMQHTTVSYILYNTQTWRELKIRNSQAKTALFWSTANSPMTQVKPIRGIRKRMALSSLLHSDVQWRVNRSDVMQWDQWQQNYYDWLT